MAQLTLEQYDDLEKAIRQGVRRVVYRRGTEFVVVPERLRLLKGREVLEAVHPTTGDHLTLFIDELDEIEVVR